VAKEFFVDLALELVNEIGSIFHGFGLFEPLFELLLGLKKGQFALGNGNGGGIFTG
jgi:hypothetical protein